MRESFDQKIPANSVSASHEIQGGSGVICRRKIIWLTQEKEVKTPPTKAGLGKHLAKCKAGALQLTRTDRMSQLQWLILVAWLPAFSKAPGHPGNLVCK